MPPSSEACSATHLPLPGRREGKVRDSYSLGPGRRLIVTTDRLSAFDRVLGCVPGKGQVLNQLTNFWFARTSDILPNHLLQALDPNAVVAIEATSLPIEVIVRGYITGVTKTSLWYRYSLGERKIYGYRLPDGLSKNQALPEPLITPTTKGGPTGHDERLSSAEVVEGGWLSADLWSQVQSAALTLFKRGQQTAAECGLVLVDTKYEFGLAPDGRLLLIDEVHTPDSSRYWRSPDSQESMDKEFLRLAYAERGYRGEGEPPELAPELWEQVGALYREVYERLTGQAFVPAPGNVEERLSALLKELA